MAVPLDPLGNVILSLQIVILFLLILGLPFVKGRDSKRNVTRHGYLTAFALVLHTILIFVIMVPSFYTNFHAIGGLSLLESVDVWSHIVLGTVAEIVGVAIVALWLKSPKQMTCVKRKGWMMPLFAIWAISLVSGAVVYILSII